MATSTGQIGYGRHMAQAYDSLAAPGAGGPVDLVVEVLKELSDGGQALELGVGTGRIALPLSAAGVAVTGIDSSPEMLEMLRAKPGGAELPVLLGNFRDLEGGPYDLIYTVFDTFWHLLEQDDQVACFANAGQALSDEGIFLIETTLAPFKGETQFSIQESDDERVVLRMGSYDSVHQVASSTTLIFSGGDVRAFPVRMRYAPPAELDLMARIAGLTLKDRWGDWERNPVTSRSSRAISVYQLQTGRW
jgi:cyclopropane fatty-acyl-phospholipid synthase-like methyltransferase